MITHIRVTLTRVITETLRTESMQLFYEQLSHIRPETPCPLMVIRAHRHLLPRYHRGRAIIKMELPVPCARARQSCTRCPGAEDIISKSWKRCGAHRSKTCLHGPVKTAFGPDLSGITFVIGSSNRFLHRASRNGKHGPMSGTGPSAGARAATPPQTTTRVEVSVNAG